MKTTTIGGPGCLGVGSVYDLAQNPRRGVIKKNPIGFVHFPDPPVAKRKPVKVAKAKPKKRKR